MQIISGKTDFVLDFETAVAIGKFDGVHVGHRELLNEILAQKSAGLKSCVFTFDPPPSIFFGITDKKVLTTKEEKRKIFEQLGIDVLVEFPLNIQTAEISAEDFVRDYLKMSLKAGFVAAGTDLSFGAGGHGNPELLCRMGNELGMDIKIIDKVCAEGEEISSTLVRKMVESGKMAELKNLLGMPYPIMGTVIHGNHIGSKIGFPTINIRPEEDKLLPPNGVYLSEVTWRGRRIKGISNIGYKPTVTEEKVMGVETFLYDFEEDIYGETIEIYLKDFLREEKKFGSLEELKAQLLVDIEAGRIQSDF